VLLLQKNLQDISSIARVHWDLRPEQVFLKCETRTLLRTVGMTGSATSLGNVTARCTRHCLPPFGGAVSGERLSTVSTQVRGVFHCVIVAAQIKASAKKERGVRQS
jgi:hypothetical protein